MISLIYRVVVYFAGFFSQKCFPNYVVPSLCKIVYILWSYVFYNLFSIASRILMIFFVACAFHIHIDYPQ